MARTRRRHGLVRAAAVDRAHRRCGRGPSSTVFQLFGTACRLGPGAIARIFRQIQIGNFIRAGGRPGHFKHNSGIGNCQLNVVIRPFAGGQARVGIIGTPGAATPPTTRFGPAAPTPAHARHAATWGRHGPLRPLVGLPPSQGNSYAYAKDNHLMAVDIWLSTLTTSGVTRPNHPQGDALGGLSRPMHGWA